MRAGTISLWQFQANELADEQAKKGSALYPSAAQSCNGRASFLGWLAKFMGRLHAYVKFRGLERCGAQGVEREQRTLPGKLVVLQRELRSEEGHTRQVFAHAHAGEDGQVLVLLEVRVLQRTTGERACGTGVAEWCRGRSGVLRKLWNARQKPKRRTLVGGANLACDGLGG